MTSKCLIRCFCLTVIVEWMCALSIGARAQDVKRNVFDGGMTIHTGFISGNIEPIGFSASGMPFGVGGILHYHISDHFRIGGEGHVSTLRQMGNGSYIRYGWGGILGDFRWTFGKFAPYAGLTIGGGANTDLIMFEPPSAEWGEIGKSYFRHKGFFFVDPFVGCDYALTKIIHLTLKMDFLIPVGNDLQMPVGPRMYFGILFYH